ncbi:MAG: general secretion pathway protein GspK [Planctomycetales bacterium]|nr:general secretion pathway protein GspK [Planctomycetales bacterium]
MSKHNRLYQIDIQKIVTPQIATGRRSRRGIAIILVFVVVALLALAAYGLLVAVQTDYRQSRSIADQLQLQRVSESGQQFMSAWMQLPLAQRALLLEGDAGQVFAQPILDTSTDSPRVVGSFYIERIPSRDDAARDILQSFPDVTTDTVSVPYVDESTKLHLGTLLEWDKQFPGSGRAALMHLPGMTPELADAILDWIDDDSVPREFGAEQDYYATSGSAAYPPNAVPAALDELLNVRGMSAERLLGTAPDALPAELLGPNESDSVATLESSSPPESFALSPDGGEQGPWSDFLTVSSAERNLARDGRTRVFVNQVDLIALHQAIVERMPQPFADYVVLARQYGVERQSAGDASPPAAMPAIDFAQPAKLPITNLLDLVDSTVRVTVGEQVVIVPSPWTQATGGEVGQMGWHLDQLTVNEEPRLVGRINLREASRTVLMMLPEMTDADVELILSRREMAPAGSDLSWLWMGTNLEFSRVRDWWPYLTTEGHVVQFRLRAQAGDSPRHIRTDVILDAAGQEPTIVFQQAVWSKRP